MSEVTFYLMEAEGASFHKAAASMFLSSSLANDEERHAPVFTKSLPYLLALTNGIAPYAIQLLFDSAPEQAICS